MARTGYQRSIPFDPQIFSLQKLGGRVVCKICPQRNGKRRDMKTCHVAEHCATKIHKDSLILSLRTQEKKICSLPAQSPSPSPPLTPAAHSRMDYDIPPLEDPERPITPSFPLVMSTEDDDSGHDHELELPQLWDPSTRMFALEEPDLYSELIAARNRGDALFTCSLQPLADELGLDDDDMLDPPPDDNKFGLFLEGEEDHINNQLCMDDSTYPWPSKATFITDLLFGSTRLRFSEAQKKAVLSWAREMGAQNVPTLYALRKAQDHDYSNPLTRFCMQDYPEDGRGNMSQVHHGSKMLHELPEELLVPSVCVNGGIYFRNELLQSTTGFFIPTRFFQANISSCDAEQASLQVLALGHPVAGFAVDPERIILEVSSFQRTYIDLQADVHLCGFTSTSQPFAAKMPNPLREKSNGRLVLTVPQIIFMDDVSGNVSKQWNKHHAVYMSNASMPCEMLEKEFCVRFVSSSPHASPMEIAKAVKESIEAAVDEGIVAYDCKYKDEVMLIPYGLFDAGDNPMQAEECSHGGLHCNYFCRTCKVGGTTSVKQSDEGYLKLFEIGELRRPEETIQQILEQIELSKLSGGTTKVQAAVSSTGTHDTTSASIVNRLLELGKRLRKREPGKPAINEREVRQTLEREFEEMLGGLPYTPTEILHTILLGVVKYFWGQTIWILDKTHLVKIFQTRLDNINKDGLNSPTLGAEYICRYSGSLIGKHFKSLAQIMPFLIYDLVPSTVLNGWAVIGQLVVLLWHTRIDDVEEYLACLTHTIDDFLNISVQCAPSIILTKSKFHFLLHIPAYIRRFGPPILFSTERFESFNHVFRLSCVHSNRQALSRDSCNAFAYNDILKHVTTGGFWMESKSKRWVHAAPGVLNYISDHPEQRHLLGVPTVHQNHPGMATVPTSSKTSPVPWTSTRSSMLRPEIKSSNNAVFQASSVIAVNGDKVAIEKYAILRGNGQLPAEMSIGKIVEIIVSESSPRVASHVVIRPLHFLPDIHPQLRLLQLQLADEEHLLFALANLHILQNILSAVNVQHDCASSSCGEFVSVNIQQERTETTKTKTSLVIPQPLHMAMSLPFLPNSREVRLKAARTVRAKKAGTTDTAECTGSAPPVFDRATRKPKQGGKDKKGPSFQPPMHSSLAPQPVVHPLAHSAFSIPPTPVHVPASHHPPMPAYAGTYHHPVHVPASHHPPMPAYAGTYHHPMYPAPYVFPSVFQGPLMYPLPSPTNTHFHTGL
ncbi:uncharacterized protein EDB93DRAFT_1255149 [Suillus bovinus]|uniref:uncharacterized protein n=1 Tax=Suillus bovinus TaxID=48563 RepID=UPI001B85E769|nr:uncharacterized protein EDB93DRAFT_1255149 [Suillus bovinus]KAG2132739.1 hypothetical protein EDB93DRAFT_1255149 [Suillus bovinus]